jgi:hypothetical protein
MEEAPDYREDTNDGQGWLLLHEFYRPLYEGDPCRGQAHHQTLGAARLAARQLGCAGGIARVQVVSADERRQVVCEWDKRREDPYWYDADFIEAFERVLDRLERQPSRAH